MGAFFLTQAFVRRLRDAKLPGRIINITSQHGMVGCPGHFSYSVSKGGLLQMTRQIAVEHGVGLDVLVARDEVPFALGAGLQIADRRLDRAWCARRRRPSIRRAVSWC